jgi:four helix bundle protein
MGGARSFRELKGYQAARQAAGRIFAMTKSFPGEERYALTDQIRRSSRAVKAMIAEAWAIAQMISVSTHQRLTIAAFFVSKRNLHSPITDH